MKSDVVQWRRKKWEKDLERLDTAIQVLVVDGVLIVPHAVGRACHFITDEENAVVTRVRLDLVYRAASPGEDGGLCSRRRANRRK